MHKILIILFLFLFCSLSVYANYIPIDENDSQQYRNEINMVINSQIPNSKKCIDNVFEDIEKEKNQHIKLALVEQGINSILLEFYIKLIDITDKYTNIKKDIPNTDWYGDIKIIIDPYLNDNNINTTELNSFLRYASEKQKKLEKKYYTNAD